MDWRKAAMEDLRKYPMQKESLENLEERIKMLKDRMQSIKSGLSDTTPVQGGAGSMVDSLVNYMAERKRLEYTYRATNRMVDLVERGLAGLDKKEKLVLDRFYINPIKGNVERLMDELNREKSQVYRIKDDALYKFTVNMYGLIDY